MTDNSASLWPSVLELALLSEFGFIDGTDSPASPSLAFLILTGRIAVKRPPGPGDGARVDQTDRGPHSWAQVGAQCIDPTGSGMLPRDGQGCLVCAATPESLCARCASCALSQWLMGEDDPVLWERILTAPVSCRHPGAAAATRDREIGPARALRRRWRSLDAFEAMEFTNASSHALAVRLELEGTARLVRSGSRAATLALAPGESACALVFAPDGLRSRTSVEPITREK